MVRRGGEEEGGCWEGVGEEEEKVKGRCDKSSKPEECDYSATIVDFNTPPPPTITHLHTPALPSHLPSPPPPLL